MVALDERECAEKKTAFDEMKEAAWESRRTRYVTSKQVTELTRSHKKVEYTVAQLEKKSTQKIAELKHTVTCLEKSIQEINSYKIFKISRATRIFASHLDQVGRSIILIPPLVIMLLAGEVLEKTVGEPYCKKHEQSLRQYDARLSQDFEGLNA